MPNASYNRVTLAGHLARDPESKAVGQSTLTIIAIETSRSYTYQGQQKNESATVEVEFFGRSGDDIRNRCRQGSFVLVEARLKVFNGQSQAGKAYSKLSVAGESCQIIDGAGGQPRQASPAPRPVAAATAPPAPAPAEDVQEDDDSDIPF